MSEPGRPNSLQRHLGNHASRFELPPLEAYKEEIERAGRSSGTRPLDVQPESNNAVPFAFQRLDAVDAKPRQAIIQGIGFDVGSVAAVVGSPNAGKTAIMISQALAISSGAREWLGLKVASGPVVYFAAEAPTSVVQRARAALGRLASEGTPELYISDAVPAIGGEYTTLADANRIVATIEAVQAQAGKPPLIAYFDTLASCLGDGDENGDGMLRLVAAGKLVAAKTGVCVVLIHHPSKGDGGGLRGHGSLAAACDSIIRIETEELTGVRTATLTKARDHATGKQFRFELEQVVLPEKDYFGDLCTTIVVKMSTQAAPRPRPSGARQRELLNDLERRYRTGEQHFDEAAICRAGRELGMPRNSPADALRGLIKAGYVVGSSSSYTLKFPPDAAS